MWNVGAIHLTSHDGTDDGASRLSGRVPRSHLGPQRSTKRCTGLLRRDPGGTIAGERGIPILPHERVFAAFGIVHASIIVVIAIILVIVVRIRVPAIITVASLVFNEDGSWR